MFYTGLHIAYAVLLCAALWLNRACWRTFILSVVVAAGVFAPVPWCTPVTLWYFKCFLGELLVLVGVLAVRSTASCAVAIFVVLAAGVHLLGAIYGPSSGIGPYKITMPLLETCQLLMCVLLSHATRQLWERRILRGLFERQL